MNDWIVDNRKSLDVYRRDFGELLRLIVVDYRSGQCDVKVDSGPELLEHWAAGNLKQATSRGLRLVRELLEKAQHDLGAWAWTPARPGTQLTMGPFVVLGDRCDKCWLVAVYPRGRAPAGVRCDTWVPDPNTVVWKRDHTHIDNVGVFLAGLLAASFACL